MVEKKPVAEPMLNNEDATVKPWEEIYPLMADGGSEPTHWLATVRPDGRPHIVPLGVVGMDGVFYFTTGQGTRKGKNLDHNSHCTISLSSRDFDIVVEGVAAKVCDEAKLQRVAEVYAAQGWPAFVHDGVLDAPYSAPTTGPAPYDVYEVTPVTAFALGTTEETVNQCTRYRF